jgi:hypothetical protein
LLDRDVPFRNFILKRFGEVFLGASQSCDLLLFRQPFLFQSSLVRFSGFQPLTFLLQTGGQLRLFLLELLAFLRDAGGVGLKLRCLLLELRDFLLRRGTSARKFLFEISSVRLK